MSMVDTPTGTDGSQEPAAEAATTTPETGVETPSVGSGEFYKVKVNGQEAEVSAEELVKGYQRQADFTRKTQELAAEKQRLRQAEMIAEALDTDPQRTLTVLAQSYGVQFGDTHEEGDDLMDPEDARLKELDARLARQEQAQLQIQVDRELAGLEAKYGTVDRQELLDHAIRTDAPSLEVAYRDMRYDELASQVGRSQAQEVDDAAVLERKRAAGLISGGSSTATGTVGTPPEKISTVREAWEAAKKSLGG